MLYATTKIVKTKGYFMTRFTFSLRRTINFTIEKPKTPSLIELECIFFCGNIMLLRNVVNYAIQKWPGFMSLLLAIEKITFPYGLTLSVVYYCFIAVIYTFRNEHKLRSELFHAKNVVLRKSVDPSNFFV